MSLVVGLTGPNAAGKGEVALYLAGLGFAVHSLSDVVREEAIRLGYPPEREHLIRIGNQLRHEKGPGAIAAGILERLGTRDVVDSIRNPAEVTVLRTLPRFFLLGVQAKEELRFARSLARAREGDPRTIEEFRARELQENSRGRESQQLDATFRLADRLVSNDEDLGGLHRQIDRVLREWEADGSSAD